MKRENVRANQVCEAIDRCFADVTVSRTLYGDVLKESQDTKPVRHRLSFGIVLAAVLIIAAAVAVAAGLGLFGQLGQQKNADGRLSTLEKVSIAQDSTITTSDGITVAIRQAYYDGTRVFVSYELSGPLTTIETHEGKPEVDQWLDVHPGEHYRSSEESPSDAEADAAAWLDGDAPRWVSLHDASIHDGLFLMDGTYLDIIGGDDVRQADGSYLGWKECEVPAALASDVLQVKAVLFRGTRMIYQDADGYKVAYTRDDDTTDIPFTVKKDTTVQPLSGKIEAAIYTAQAAMSFTPVDLKGEIKLTCPADWIHSWEDWDFDGGDAIREWQLYAGDALIADHPEECEVKPDSESGTLTFTVVFRHTSTADGLRLVPVYRDSGVHADEEIPLAEE